MVLTQSDTLFLWSYDEQKYLKCFLRHSLSIRNMYWSARSILLLASDGVLYHGTIEKCSIDSTSNQECEEEFVEQKSNKRVEISEKSKCEIHLKRIPNIDRITNIAVDQRGESFVILQENSKRYLSIPMLDDDPITFKALLNETTEFDLLHDIVFHVGLISN